MIVRTAAELDAFSYFNKRVKADDINAASIRPPSPPVCRVTPRSGCSSSSHSSISVTGDPAVRGVLEHDLFDPFDKRWNLGEGPSWSCQEKQQQYEWRGITGYIVTTANCKNNTYNKSYCTISLDYVYIYTCKSPSVTPIRSYM